MSQPKSSYRPRNETICHISRSSKDKLRHDKYISEHSCNIFTKHYLVAVVVSISYFYRRRCAPTGFDISYTVTLVHSAALENRLRIPLVTFPGPTS